MYSKRSPPTGPAGMELPYISIPASWGIAPSTGISLSRRYSSMLSSTCGAAIRRVFIIRLSVHILESAMSTVQLYGSLGTAVELLVADRVRRDWFVAAHAKVWRFPMAHDMSHSAQYCARK